MRRISMLAAVVVLLSSCSTLSSSTVVTVPAANGDEAWSRAQSYIVRNSDYRVQVVSDYVIDTYFTPDGKYFNRVGYTATREIGKKEHTLFLKVRAYGVFDYSEIPLLLINFKYYVLNENDVQGKSDAEKIREYEEWERGQAEKKRK
jgi:hypothetical protein